MAGIHHRHEANHAGQPAGEVFPPRSVLASQARFLCVVQDGAKAAAIATGRGGSRVHDHACHGLPGSRLQHARFPFVDGKTFIAGDVPNAGKEVADLCRSFVG